MLPTTNLITLTKLDCYNSGDVKCCHHIISFFAMNEYVCSLIISVIFLIFRHFTVITWETVLR
jgi:hypothetical protein